jgi:hypothetical protein
LNDQSDAVRAHGGRALAYLLVLQRRVDPVVTDLINTATGNNDGGGGGGGSGDVAVQTSTLLALARVFDRKSVAKALSPPIIVSACVGVIDAGVLQSFGADNGSDAVVVGGTSAFIAFVRSLFLCCYLAGGSYDVNCFTFFLCCS